MKMLIYHEKYSIQMISLYIKLNFYYSVQIRISGCSGEAFNSTANKSALLVTATAFPIQQNNSDAPLAVPPQKLLQLSFLMMIDSLSLHLNYLFVKLLIKF